MGDVPHTWIGAEYVLSVLSMLAYERYADRSLVLAGVTSAIAHMMGAVDAEVLLLGEGGQLELVAAEGVLDGQEQITVRLADVPWVESAIRTGRPSGAPI